MRNPFRNKKFRIIILVIVLVLIVIRLALPYVVLHYANKDLAHNIKGYYGHINNIDIALIRGAYKIDSIYINKVDSAKKIQTPFFSARLIDISVEWKALLHGSFVGEFVFEDPILRFTKDKVEPAKVRKDSSSFNKLRDDFMPLQVNRFEVNNGKLQYKDEFSHPKVDIEMNETHILAENLRNSYDSGALLPAKVNAMAHIYEGTLNFDMKLNPLADNPTFDMNAKLQHTNLVKLNEFLKAYAKIDVNKGTFGLYTEVAAKNGRFKGYVKPIIKDLDVLGHEDRKDNIFQKAWEGIVGVAAEVFKNQKKDQVATKVPFSGNLKDPNTNTWYAIEAVLMNAFIRALQPSIDSQINIQSVGKSDAPAKESKEKKKKKEK
jgi:hypothetical protein